MLKLEMRTMAINPENSTFKVTFPIETKDNNNKEEENTKGRFKRSRSQMGIGRSKANL